MKSNAAENSSANERQFELKYCERCGSLWLRPLGGEQIYCGACGRAVAELPPASYYPNGAAGVNMPPAPRWGVDDSDIENCEEYEGLDFDAAGGAA
jgi:hypothetical protein